MSTLILKPATGDSLTDKEPVGDGREGEVGRDAFVVITSVFGIM